MNTIDIILLVIMLAGIVNGIRKGLVSQIESIAAIFLGVWMSYKFASAVSVKLSAYFDTSEEILKIAAFALIFIVVALGLRFLCGLLEKIIRAVMLGWFNRLAGAVFCVVKYMLIVSVIIIVLNTINSKIPFIKTDIFSNSTIYPYVKDFAYKVFPFFKELIASK